MANLYKRIRTLRKEKKMKQGEVAEILGLSISSYCRYERGEREPDAAVLWRMADLYEVSVDYLIGRSEER